MQWLQVLALLACPLMMLFCMKGMFGGSKESKTASAQSHGTDIVIQQLQIHLADLMEQNHKLMKEIETLKSTSSNIIELTEDELSKKEIS
ncbi:DUF2933 domain-containing protein [Paenibacillus alkalitolerans]|uniref:DUF2933 domain-containing protein n=1 Tax=Paenibacillus alkalitolerans TaxID=2799335 RepID=UPI0018F627EB|nr:DUF2933 domain-containing protein [Paenibacillus alkalitolerans]